MAEQYGLTDTDELPVNVYTPTETFWVKWRKDKAVMKDKGFHVVKVNRSYLVLHFFDRKN